MEEHIKNAFISETASTESVFRHLKIDPDSMEIKRLLDQEVLKTALSFRETVSYRFCLIKIYDENLIFRSFVVCTFFGVYLIADNE